jgi:hypothetical protein
MYSSILQYITAFIILFIILFSYCHVSRLKTINNELKILQAVDPTADIVYDLLDKHQPIILQREMLYWKEFNNLLGDSLINIKNMIAQNSTINYSEYIKNNIDIYNLPLSYDWNIDVRNVILNNQSAIFFTKQNNYMQLFGCVTGEMRVIITTPNQTKFLEPFVNMVSSIDATQLLDKEPMELNFIEIIIRKGNIIYIPWNWCYFIYKSNANEECVIVDCINSSVLSFI